MPAAFNASRITAASGTLTPRRRTIGVRRSCTPTSWALAAVGSAAIKSTSQSAQRVKPARYSSLQFGQNNDASCAPRIRIEIPRRGLLGMTVRGFRRAKNAPVRIADDRALDEVLATLNR